MVRQLKQNTVLDVERNTMENVKTLSFVHIAKVTLTVFDHANKLAMNKKLKKLTPSQQKESAKSNVTNIVNNSVRHMLMI